VKEELEKFEECPKDSRPGWETCCDLAEPAANKLSNPSSCRVRKSTTELLKGFTTECTTTVNCDQSGKFKAGLQGLTDENKDIMDRCNGAKPAFEALWKPRCEIGEEVMELLINFTTTCTNIECDAGKEALNKFQQCSEGNPQDIPACCDKARPHAKILLKPECEDGKDEEVTQLLTNFTTTCTKIDCDPDGQRKAALETFQQCSENGRNDTEICCQEAQPAAETLSIPECEVDDETTELLTNFTSTCKDDLDLVAI